MAIDALGEADYHRLRYQILFHGVAGSSPPISGDACAAMAEIAEAPEERSYGLEPNIPDRATDWHVRSHVNGSDRERHSARSGEGRQLYRRCRRKSDHRSHRDHAGVLDDRQ